MIKPVSHALDECLRNGSFIVHSEAKKNANILLSKFKFSYLAALAGILVVDKVILEESMKMRV